MKIQAICTLALLSIAAGAQAYDTTDFVRQYKDTIAIVETNYKEKLPVSEYERQQIFKKEFLFRAAEFGPRALLEKALALATNPRQLLTEDMHGRTVLFYAADAETVDTLILRLQQLEVKEQFDSIWNYYQKEKRTQRTKEQTAPKFINKTDDEGAPALFVLLREGKSTAANRLIERGAKLTITDNDGVTALHMAVLAAQDDNPQAKALVKLISGRAPYLAVAKDKEGRTPADWARRDGYIQTYEFLSARQKRVEASQAKDRAPSFDLKVL